MFFSDMERKTLAITPPSSSSFRGGGFGSSKKSFHCLLLLSCLLLSSVNTLHNLAEFDGGFINGYNSGGLASSAAKRFNGGNVCPIYEFDDDVDVDDWIVMMISNNLSDDGGGGGVVWLSLKPLHIIEFKSFSGYFHIGEEEEDTKQLLYATKKYREEFSVSVSVSSWLKYCGGNQCWDSVKFLFLYGKNTVVSGLVSSGNGVVMEQCCWDSIKFLFLYGNEFSSGVAVFAVPMKATAPVLMLNLCKKPVFRVQQRAKKLSMIVVLVIAVLAAALLLLMFCFNDHHHHDFDNNIGVGKVEKPITISREMNSLLRSISNETMTSFDEEVTENMALKEETSEEALNLIVKTAKDKKRRRNKKNKKKKGGVVINNGLLSTDVSSSHSGNSTPNSPMSPPPPPKPEPTTTIQAATKPAKPVLSHSATFPVSGVKSMMIERSSLAPNVRAPGSKSNSRTEVKEEEETKKKAAKEYDIWGDHHLTWLNLMDRFKEVREGKSKSSGFGFGEEVDDESDESFFVKGPQNYLGDSSVRFVSFCNQWG